VIQPLETQRDRLSRFFNTVKDQSTLDKLEQIFKEASQETSDLEPTQIREIEPIRSWLTSRYYNALSKNTYPYWQEEIADFIDGGYSEWVITGSLGTGKSTAALITVQRKIYELSCWDFPQRLFKLADISNIFFAYLSVNLKQADLTGFGQIRSMLDATRYFVDDFSRDRVISSVLKFPKKLFMVPGSDAISVIGMNLFGTILDEANFYRKGGSSAAGDIAKAQEMYAETTDRRRSRFMMKGKDAGFSLLVSSSTHQSSFTSSRIKKADSSVKVTSASLWEVKSGNYSEKRFFVFNGSDKDDPFIINKVEDLADIIKDPEDMKEPLREAKACCCEATDVQVRMALPHLPEYIAKSVTEVPIDFRASFETDIYKALRNIAGVSIAPVGKLFSSRRLYAEAVSSELTHPFTVYKTQLSLKDNKSLRGIFRSDLFFKDGRPVRHPNAPRYIHVDQSLTTCNTGISCTHMSSMESRNGIVVPSIEVDFMLAIEPPPPPDKIALHKIREFIVYLISLGLPLGAATFDQFQSEDSIQTLQRQGINAFKIPTTDVYPELVSLYREGRIKHYQFDLYQKELFGLEIVGDKQKVVKPEIFPDGTKGSKDVSDAVASSVKSCLTDTVNVDLYREDAINSVQFVNYVEEQFDPDLSWLLPAKYRGTVKVKGKEVK
jgi:hypothetical protein